MKEVRISPRVAAVLLLFLLASGAAAQDAAISAPEKVEAVVPSRKILVFYRDESAAPAAREKILLRESLLISLQNVREDCFAVEAEPLAGPDGDDEKSSLARRRACDGWFFARVGDSPAGLRVDYVLYDSISLVYAARASFEARRPDARDLARVFWRDAAATLASLPPLDPLPSFVVRGTPGTRIFGLGKKGLRLDGEGSAEVSVPVPGIYTVRAEKPGYDPVVRQVLVKESDGEIVLDQKRGSLFSLDFSLLNAQYPGFDVAVFAVPNAFFLKTGFTSFFNGIGGFLSSSDDETADIMVSHPLLHLTIQAGFYARAADSYFRPYLGAGALVRLFFADSGTVVEPVVPYAVFPVFGFEFSADPKSRFYLEATPTAYYVARRNLVPGMDFNEYVTDYLYSDGGAGFNLAETWFVDVLSFRVGFRRHL